MRQVVSKQYMRTQNVIVEWQNSQDQLPILQEVAKRDKMLSIESQPQEDFPKPSKSSPAVTDFIGQDQDSMLAIIRADTSGHEQSEEDRRALVLRNTDAWIDKLLDEWTVFNHHSKEAGESSQQPSPYVQKASQKAGAAGEPEKSQSHDPETIASLQEHIRRLTLDLEKGRRYNAESVMPKEFNMPSSFEADSRPTEEARKENKLRNKTHQFRGGNRGVGSVETEDYSSDEPPLTAKPDRNHWELYNSEGRTHITRSSGSDFAYGEMEDLQTRLQEFDSRSDGDNMLTPAALRDDILLSFDILSPLAMDFLSNPPRDAEIRKVECVWLNEAISSRVVRRAETLNFRTRTFQRELNPIIKKAETLLLDVIEASEEMDMADRRKADRRKADPVENSDNEIQVPRRGKSSRYKFRYPLEWIHSLPIPPETRYIPIPRRADTNSDPPPRR